MLLLYLYLINIILHRWASIEYPRKFNNAIIANKRGFRSCWLVKPSSEYKTIIISITWYILYFIIQLQFLWSLYKIPAIISCIPLHVRDDRIVCSTVTILVCFEAVQWHPSNRVTRQFSDYQLILPYSINLEEFYNQHSRGKIY